jgi:hypothetical protein
MSDIVWILAAIIGALLTGIPVRNWLKKRERDKASLEVTELVKIDIAKRDALIEAQRTKDREALAQQRRLHELDQQELLTGTPTREEVERVIRESKE